MHLRDGHPWQHTHTFGTDEFGAGERRTRWVIALTFSMMVVEIIAGIAFGSMALLADGWHMATHAAALGIAAFAYAYARWRANDRRYSFGTGKVSALGGFGSAVGLAVVAVLVLVESVGRLASPVSIRFNEAIGVAVVGLLVNLLSAVLLRDHEHDAPHPSGQHHDHIQQPVERRPGEHQPARPRHRPYAGTARWSPHDPVEHDGRRTPHPCGDGSGA